MRQEILTKFTLNPYNSLRVSKIFFLEGYILELPWLLALLLIPLWFFLLLLQLSLISPSFSFSESSKLSYSLLFPKATSSSSPQRPQRIHQCSEYIWRYGKNSHALLDPKFFSFPLICWKHFRSNNTVQVLWLF